MQSVTFTVGLSLNATLSIPIRSDSYLYQRDQEEQGFHFSQAKKKNDSVSPVKLVSGGRREAEPAQTELLDLGK